jgi:phosphoribosylamine--glycine ligase/phosphoribosylformylglycinamidine cyclo-ligase
MRVLVLGSGGREHALVWKLSQSTTVDKIFLFPGNGGSHQEQKVFNVNLSTANFPALVKFATENEVRPVTTFFPLRSTLILIRLIS